MGKGKGWGQKGGCDRESKGGCDRAKAMRDASHGDEVDAETNWFHEKLLQINFSQINCMQIDVFVEE